MIYLIETDGAYRASFIQEDDGLNFIPPLYALTRRGRSARERTMSLLCFFGRHRPSLASIKHGRDGGYLAHCDACAVPLERDDKGAWHAAAPLSDRDRTA